MPYFPHLLFFILLALGACEVAPDPTTADQRPPERIPTVVRESVATLVADSDCGAVTRGLLPEALEDAGMSTTLPSRPSRPWRLALHERAMKHPVRGACEARQLQDSTRRVEPAGTGVVGASIRRAAAWLGEGAPYRDRLGPIGLDGARQLVCEDGGCAEQGTLPASLADAVAVLIVRAHRAAEAERARRADRGTRTVAHWVEAGGDGLLASATGSGFDVTFEPDRTYLDGSRVDLFEAAAALAEAIEALDWASFRGLEGIDWRLETRWGPVVVADARPHAHRFDVAPLLLIDLGGAETYRGHEGSTGEDRPVAVVIDLGGADDHGYPEMRTDSTTDLQADGDGRWTGGRFVDVSVSAASRQGGARTGVAMWFDLGSENDVYVALRASQGYAHHGVGVLYDQGGDDEYRLEAAGQGTAQFGIGLLIDAGDGRDRYRADYAAQGHGYTAGVGMLVDAGGDDEYRCAPEGTRYPSDQLAGAQVSLCQGVGFGYRDLNGPHAMAGGLGVLLDEAGNDFYESGVYGQGVGIADGVGVFVDRSGRDEHIGLWYGMGAGVHGGVGIFVDRGRDEDRYGASRASHNAVLGVGHDDGRGLFVDEGGNDQYRLEGLAAGAATCGSVGLFVDEAGEDVYDGTAARGLGFVSSVECATPGVAAMIDAGGTDRYPPPTDRNRRSWRSGETGLGLDGEGSSGLAGADNVP